MILILTEYAEKELFEIVSSKNSIEIHKTETI